MAPPSSIQFIDAALSCTGPLALSYSTAHQKWIIREHLHLLIRDFPSFFPSIDTFVHNDGTSVNLLNTSGFLPISSNTPPISLTIWLHQTYPYEPPLVFLSSTPTDQIPRDHPFVDPSGATMSPYLNTWTYPRSNLLDLARNLVRLFNHHHPFFSPSPSISSTLMDPTLASRMEALDRLVGAIHFDMVAIRAKAEEDIEGLSSLQAEMVNRADILNITLHRTEHERLRLKQRVMELAGENDVLTNWLRVNDPGSIISNTVEEAFEAIDEESNCVLDCQATDEAIEDVLYALGKAMMEGVVPLGDYLKQVRALSREQFFHRAMLVKLRSLDTLNRRD